MLKRVIKSVILLLVLIFVAGPGDVRAQESQKLNFLLMGTDSGYGRPEALATSRSDAIMIATLDPGENTLTLSSIPRDTLVYIPGYYEDKINHAFAFGGIDLTKLTLESWLDVEFDYYVAANMTGYIEIVDSLEGLRVTPPTSFEISGHEFVEGVGLEIDGDQALGYARERKTSGGDYARQARMREMVKVAVEKVLEQGEIESYRSLFENRPEVVITDINFEEMVNLYETYGNENLAIEEFQLTGDGYTDESLGYIDVSHPESLAQLLEILY